MRCAVPGAHGAPVHGTAQRTDFASDIDICVGGFQALLYTPPLHPASRPFIVNLFFNSQYFPPPYCLSVSDYLLVSFSLYF